MPSRGEAARETKNCFGWRTELRNQRLPLLNYLELNADNYLLGQTNPTKLFA